MRKHLLFLMTALTLNGLANAQSNEVFKSFRVDIGLGSSAQNSELKGVLLYFEPNCTFAGKLKAGVRFEYAMLNMDNIGSSAITTDYYFFRDGGFRVFAGGGFALFNSSLPSGGCGAGLSSIQMISKTKKGGAMLRAGFDFNHLHFGLEYNFVPSTYVTYAGSNNQTGPPEVYKNGYLGIKLGVSIGGGKKKNNSQQSEQ